jgi:hypothetical protein
MCRRVKVNFFVSKICKCFNLIFSYPESWYPEKCQDIGLYQLGQKFHLLLIPGLYIFLKYLLKC